MLQKKGRTIAFIKRKIVYRLRLLAQVGGLTSKNTFNSIRDAKIKKTAYISKHICPTFRFNLNLV